MRELLQQGDVLVVRVNALPAGAERTMPDESGRYVLVRGEHTGHAHWVSDSNGVEVSVTPQGRHFLKVLSVIELYHDTHLPQIILPGLYEVERVREIDPFTMVASSVKD